MGFALLCLDMNSYFSLYSTDQGTNTKVNSSESTHNDMIALMMNEKSSIPQSTPNYLISQTELAPHYQFPSMTSSCANPHLVNFQKNRCVKKVNFLDDPTEKLKHFLATAPSNWEGNEFIRRFPLGNGETIACIYWNGLFFITGTDIVKILHFRFQFIHRPVINTKKFEEGIFSDLRNLKPGIDAALEEPRSEFLEMLYRNGCIRTQKKQKVFYWYSVPHERLFIDALERDLKRESNLIHVNAFLGRHQAMYSHFFYQQKYLKSPPMLLSPAACKEISLAPQPPVSVSIPSINQPQTSYTSIPPLAIPQPVKACGYFGSSQTSSFQADAFLDNDHKGSNFNVESSINDYFKTDLINYPSFSSNNSYAAVPESAIKRPDLFNTFI